MYFSTFAILCTTLIGVGRLAKGAPPPDHISRRQTVGVLSGYIVEPTEGSTVSAGASFPFQYNEPNICEDGYKPLTIWIVPGPNAPTPASLNSTQGFSEGTYLAYLGSYLDANFGLPEMSPGPPPSTFITPTLDPSVNGTTVYLTVVQENVSCPPDGHHEWDISSIAIEYTT